MAYVTDGIDDEIVLLLKSGAVGLLPSDTIYGLSCAVFNKESVERLHKIKHRDKGKPFVVLISGTKQLKELGIAVTGVAAALRYWPGRLTFIADAPKAPAWLQLGTGTLAVRCPNRPELLKTIDQTGPLISTSANVSGGQPATTVAVAKKYFSDKLDFYVDIGRLDGAPSTIVRPMSGKLKIIRQGVVKIDKKEQL